MDHIDKVLSWTEDALAALTLGAASMVVALGVVMRYVFNEPFAWSEEAAVYLLICSSFIGAVITLRHNEHIGVDILAAVFGRRGRLALAVLSSLLTALYCALLGGFAWLMIISPIARNATTPTLDLPLWVVQLSLPIGLTLMLVRALEILYRSARGQQTFPKTEGKGVGEEAGRGEH